MYPDFYLVQIIRGNVIEGQYVTMCTDDVELQEEVFPGMGTEFRKLKHLTSWLEENQPGCEVKITEYSFSDLPKK